MSAHELSDFGVLGGSIERAVQVEVERRVSKLLSAFGAEVQLQLRPVLEQIQAERMLSDDRHEKVMSKLDDLIVAKQGNGKGGHGG